MSRIYEAIELTGMELGQVRKEPAPIADFVPVPRSSKTFEEKLLALHRKIESLVDVPTGRVVSIAGLQSTGHGYTYAFELARVASTRLKKQVLLLGTCQSGLARHVIHDRGASGWEDATHGDRSIDDAIQQLQDPPVAVSQINLSKDSLGSLIGSPRFGNLVRQMRDRFDLILVDTPSLAEAVDAVVLAPLVDGTVVIVDAGITRWQVVRHAVDEIHAQQGRVLGVVLNKRRYYIPDYIYRRL